MDIVNEIKNIKIPHNLTLASFDINNLYTNVPINKTRHTKEFLKNNTKRIYK